MRLPHKMSYHDTVETVERAEAAGLVLRNPDPVNGT
jgi:hypothetical protein